MKVVILVIVKGAKINDRYQIIRTLGEGGMANVYLAYDTILDRNVAVKILRGDLSSDEKFVRRFQREALSASSLSHPNIVEMYDVGEDDGQYYLVMEYVEGKTLKQLLKKRGSLTITEVMDIMLQLTDGMAHAHDSYIIHRDIKPQNIMILENGMIKITDFGIAMALNSTQLTQTNSVLGSVHYLPPEQANGKGSTIKSDIYSMGILMYELLTGAIPYKGDSPVEIALKHLKEPLPSIKKILPTLPQSIENIILKSTAKNPKNRYNDAREMYEDIKTALDDSRASDSRYVYKYSENDLEDTKVLEDTIKAIEKKEKEEDSKKEEIMEKTEKLENKKQNKLLIILVSVFTGLILITTVSMFVYFGSFRNKNVKIPDVSAKSLEEASEILDEAGFIINAETETVASDEIEAGYVVKTYPEIGKKIKEGSTITIYVSSGEETFELEDYTGRNYIEVKAILESTYECNVLIEYQKVDDEDADVNKIIDMSPEAGTKVKPGANITLYLPEVEIKYPDFTDGNYSIDDVEDFCDKNDLILEIKYQEDETEEDGTILSQSRPANTIVVPGIKFTITVSTIPEIDESESE